MTVDALGVDIGGVISDRAIEDGPALADGVLAAEPIPAAFETLRLLHERFAGRVFVVSTCGVWMEHQSRRWLATRDLEGRTGISPYQVWFCRQRRDKAEIATELGLTHFVDDRLEVLSYLDAVPNRYLFAPREDEKRRFEHALPRVVQVESWPDLGRRLLH